MERLKKIGWKRLLTRILGSMKTYWFWNTLVNDNLLISEYFSQKTEIAYHPVMGMYQGELKKLSGPFEPDLGLA